MPDVAVFRVPNGAATYSIAVDGGDTVTIPGSRRRVIGPPINGALNCAGHYALELPSTDAGQTANTYRWERDVNYYTSSPTSYVYAGNGFVPLGGL